MKGSEEFKIEIYVPDSHLDVLRTALHEAGAGRLGNYDHCLAVTRVRGFWRPLEGSHPFEGAHGATSEEPESKIEVRCTEESVSRVLEAMRRVHPYEEPVINVIGLANRQFESSPDH